jgi:enterochelin esterase-like enzyme
MPPAPALTEGPSVADRTVAFALADPHIRLVGVRLYLRAGIADDQLRFSQQDGTWTLRLRLPPVKRIEYLLELEYPNGQRDLIPDPSNPRRVAGAFGEKSVIELPGYQPPTWLGSPGVAARRTPLAVTSSAIAATVTGQLWWPESLSDEQAAPLLLVHDGPEYDSLAGFTGWAASSIASGRLPAFRVALLAPGDRNRWYAADPGYARALTTGVLGALAELAPATVRIGVGASLGGLAMLHAHRSAPGSFDGLFMQSGSFFTEQLDPQEVSFSRFGPITRFVTELAQSVTDPAPIPVGLTCGVAEENLANNKAMAVALTRLGYPCRLQEWPDVHNYTAWRDALEPNLTDLIQEVLDRHET